MTEATGFLFDDPTPQALLGALKRALDAWRNPARWRALQLAGMAGDFGWQTAARAYLETYRRARA